MLECVTYYFMYAEIIRKCTLGSWERLYLSDCFNKEWLKCKKVGLYICLILCFLLIFFSFLFFKGLLCDLLWSDPDKDVQGWGENDRGVSFTFGADVVSKFLNRHDLDLICRAHQVCGIKTLGYFVNFTCFCS